MQIHAIRSLQCEDHAYNLPPTVKSIAWFIGKRCNYDCSYCGPHTHDAVSPFMDINTSLAFIKRAHDHCLQNKSKMKWTFTGGEPFIDPGFVLMLTHLSSLSTTYQINVSTNGSLPLAVYQKTADLVDGITFSIHLERTSEEIEHTIDIICSLSASSTILITVNLMFLPGKMQQIKDIHAKFQAQGVSCVVRKISPQPLTGDEYLPFLRNGTKRKDVVLFKDKLQSERKMLWKKISDAKKFDDTLNYYSTEEHEFLSQVNKKPGWHNMGVWTEDGYKEINSDFLVARQQNTFLGWTCYAGVDSIYIDFDGKIYAGVCLNQGSIGHIADSLPFRSMPMTCAINWCTCNTDIPVRKVKHLKYKKLIDNE